ncbi:MAG: hypothetical protein AAF648_00045 [Pseudomonadota bacterium]
MNALNPASLLRWLGALAVLGSGFAFLVDGLDLTTDGWRHWVPPAAMALFAAAAVGLNRFFADRHGARLLLALGLMLVTVQSAQLGGMLLEKLAPATADLVGMLLPPSAAVAWGELGGIAALSAFAAAGLIIVTLRVFAGAAARPLAGLFLLSNLLLLVPVRAGLAGALLVAAVIGLLFASRRIMATEQHRLGTREGGGIGVLLALPAALAVVRYAVYLDSLLGFSMILGSLGALLAYGAAVWLPRSRLGGALELLSLLLLGSAWSAAATTWVDFGSGQAAWLAELAVVALPVLAYWLERSRAAHLLPSFATGARAFAGLYAGLVALVSLGEPDAVYAFFALGLGAALAGWARFARSPGVGYLGLGIAIVAGLRLTADLIFNPTVDLWLVGGAVGFALVVLAGLLDRRSAEPAVALSGP